LGDKAKIGVQFPSSQVVDRKRHIGVIGRMIYSRNGVAHEDYADKNYFFVCQCCDTSHNFAITFWDHEPDKNQSVVESSAYLSVPETHYLPFWKKCFTIVKYFFGKKAEYSGVMIRHCDIPRIVELLSKYSDYLRQIATELNLNIPFEQVNLNGNELSIVDFSTSRTIVLEREKLFGDDQPWVACLTVRLPSKVGFFKKLKFAWEYLTYDSGTYCDVALTLDKMTAISAFLSNSVAYNLQVKENRFDNF